MIPLTRETLAALSEAAFRRDVLAPLFRRLGYKDVYEYHGTSELGKDFVMWRADGLRDRVNVAAVVKAGNIRGEIGNPAHAGGVALQVQQAFGNEYRDPVSGEPQSIQEVVIVASGRIKQPTVDALRASFVATGLARSVTFWDGDKVWSLIEQHLGERAVLADLIRIGTVLKNISTDFNVTASTGGNGVSVAVSPTRDGIQQVTGQIRIPLDSEHARAAHAALTEHLETGSPVTIPGEFIHFEGLPDPLLRLTGEQEFRPDSITLGPRKVDRGMVVNLHAVADGGKELVVTGIPLTVDQVGTKRIALASAKHFTSWDIALVILHQERVDFAIGIDMSRGSARELDQFHSFQRLLALGCTLEVRLSESDLPLVRGGLQAGVYFDPEPSFAAFVERLAFIQATTGKWITVPDRHISLEEVTDILTTAALLESGSVPIYGFNAEVPSTFGAARHLLEAINEQPMGPSLIKVQCVRTVLGTTLDLGPATVFMDTVNLSQSSRQLISELPPDTADDLPLSLIVEMAAGSQGRVTLDTPSFDAASFE